MPTIVLLFIRLQLTSVSLSSNSFGRIHLVAEIFDIILRSNYKVHTLWCNNNVFTGIQTRQRFAVSDKKSSEEESYARTTLNAARSKLQAAVHVYVNEHIKPRSKLVKVVPDAGASPFPFVLHSPAPTILHNLWLINPFVAGQVLQNWLASGSSSLLLSSRVRAGMWTPEPVEMPVADALHMTKGMLLPLF